MNSPSSTGTHRSRDSIVNRPLTKRKISSSFSCRCLTNGPWNLTSFTRYPLPPDDLRVPMGSEQGKLLRQVDLIHASSTRPLVRAPAGSRSLPLRCAQAVPHASQLHRVLRSVTKEQGH